MSSYRQITSSDIKLGEPLTFSVLDPDGRLLLRKGVVITMHEQVDKIIARRALMAVDFVEEAPAAGSARAPVRTGPASPPFEQVGSLVLNLKHVYTTALNAPDQIDLPARIRQFAARIQTLCDDDVDATLAAPHLDYINPYLIVHQVMGAVLAEMTARASNIGPDERLSIVCAALTRDLTLFPIQTELDQSSSPLPPTLRSAVTGHPAAAAELLRRAGVQDPVWLDAVLQHHERLDGSGYPNKLVGDAITPGARILAITDTYSAMTKPRPYRSKEFIAQNALRDMYQQKDRLLDGNLIQRMIKEIGIFPPGSIVRLKSGELGVIKHRTFRPAEAIAYTVYDQRGMPQLESVRREAANPNYEILGMVPFTECRSAAVTIKRLWAR
jgi:HD-GYP domain-containing protein (c-di-GMP phosphodiesterase class II)